MENRRKLPAGIQDFEDLRTNGYLYVDKTAYIYRLANTGKHYFLGRPRRFGKSLFLSTLKEYFLGNKKVFENLAIVELEKEWIQYPVFHLDMNLGSYLNLDSLYSVLDTNLKYLEIQWGKDDNDKTHAARFFSLIRRAYEQTGQKVVVLIDEYDKPLLGPSVDLRNMNDDILTVLKGFYGILKSSDTYLRFVFLTGVTKFSKVSVFSELNHLTDISLDVNYAGICGISASELVGNFEPEIHALAEGLGKTYDETLGELKKRYDGYHFAENTEGMYNPYSLLRTFFAGKLRDYWFETGTPTFLVRMLKDMEFDVKSLEKDVEISPNAINKYRVDTGNPVPLLYQSGYLTIKSYDAENNLYFLGLPNDEVKYGFLYELMQIYMPEIDVMTEFYAGYFNRDLKSGNIEGFMTRLKAYFAGISYELDNKTEKHYQTVFFLLLKAMGQFVEVEPRSAIGRADAIIVTADTVYAFEFKLTENATAEDALKQIDEKGYLTPYIASNKKLVKVGAEFSKTERGLKRWVVG